MITPLSSNLPCTHCQYNLKTLLPISNCPECGTPILRTIIHYEQSRARSLGFLSSQDLHNLPYITLSSFCPYPAPAVRFIHEIATALLARRPTFTNDDFSLAFRNVALLQFHSPERALETLHSWNLRTTTDLHQILSLLTQAALLPDSGKTSPAPPQTTNLELQNPFPLDQLLIDPNSQA